MFSDSAPSKEEFDQLVRDMKGSGGRMPHKQQVLDKRVTLQKAHKYVYSATTLKQMLLEKKHALSRPLNSAVEKDRLKRQLEVAESKCDKAESKEDQDKAPGIGSVTESPRERCQGHQTS